MPTDWPVVHVVEVPRTPVQVVSVATAPVSVVRVASVTGARGASAYEVAIAAGFVGTEAEWLTSLEGQDGEPGPEGPTAPSADPNNALTLGGDGLLFLDADDIGGASTWDDLTGKPTEFPPADHTHPQTDVTGLTAALDAKADLADLGTASGADTGDFATAAQGAKADTAVQPAALDDKADLVDGVIPTSQIPALAVTEFLGTVSTQAAMLALEGQVGDWTIRTDTGLTWVITDDDPTQLASWTALAYPTAPVLSVNGETGVVVLGKGDVGLGNVDNTSDVNKPVSTAQQTALDLKVNKDDAEIEIGADAFASGTETTAVGSNAYAVADHATALGADSLASGVDSVAIGDASAGGTGAVAVGKGASANGSGGVALGDSAVAPSADSVALGHSAATGAAGGVAIGRSTSAGGARGVAIGDDSSTGSEDTVALGTGASAGPAYAVAIGAGANVASDNETVLKNDVVRITPRTADTESRLVLVTDDGDDFDLTPSGDTMPVRAADIGTAAAADTDDFATAAQGTLADSAVQPGDVPELARDALGTALVAGTGIDIDVDDDANTITITATATGGDFPPDYSTVTLTEVSGDGTFSVPENFRFHTITYDDACRFRVYRTAAGRTADAARPFTTRYEGGAGLVYDFDATGAITDDKRPIQDVRDPGETVLYYSVEGGTVTITFQLREA